MISWQMIHIEKSREFGIDRLCEMSVTECPFNHCHTMTIGSTCDNEHHKLKFGKLQVYKVYNRFVDL